MRIRIPDRVVKSDSNSKILPTLKKLDIVGFAIFAPAAIQFLLALEWGGSRYVWKSSTIIGLFCGATGTFCVFLAWEHRRGDSAMIPFSIIRRRIVWCSCSVAFLFLGSMSVTSYYMPIYFQAVRNATPTMSGVYILPAILSQIVFAAVSGVLGMRLILCRLVLIRLDLQVLTNSSRQTQILSTLDHCKRSFDITRDRAHINFHTNDTSWHLDRLPDSCRRWSWMRHTNGRHTGARSDKTTALATANTLVKISL